jgi:nicotinate-nucleotide pyrophosphorylase (carboxylating)
MKATPPFDSPAVAALVALALAEDGTSHDVTTIAVVPKTARGVGTLVAKAEGVLAGLPLLAADGPFLRAFPTLMAEPSVAEGARVRPGDRLAVLRGSGAELLSSERTLLNFLQRLSGIATATASYVEAVRGTRAVIQETRKTCPGWRALDKYAVRVGGGFNHRFGLSDQVLIKENHLAFAGLVRSPDAVRRAVAAAQRSTSRAAEVEVEVEVETLEQLDAALDAGADIVLLDNMSPADHAEAVRRRDARKSSALLEASGGVTLASVRAIAETGVDRISVGALTHSVRALDLSLDLTPDGA